MDALILIVGIAIGVVVTHLLLRAQNQAQTEVLREEISQALQAKAETDQARIIRSYETRIHELTSQHTAALVHARRQSTARSRAVLKGKLSEQIAPLLPGFNYQPTDARFLGDPIDYVVFHGYGQVKEHNADGDTLEIVLLDIKKGKSTLSREQRQIARAVEEGRVSFEVVRIFADGTVRSHTWHSHRKQV